MEVLYRLSYRGIFSSRGGGRIRTSVGEAGRFTVCSLWPLGHTPPGTPRGPRRETPGYSSKRRRLFNAAPEEPGKGFEPPTCRLQGGCSTTELPRRVSISARRPAGDLSARYALRAPLSARSSLRLPLLSTLRPLRPRLSATRLSARFRA